MCHGWWNLSRCNKFCLRSRHLGHGVVFDSRAIPPPPLRSATGFSQREKRHHNPAKRVLDF
jgi:hypothetical protein